MSSSIVKNKAHYLTIKKDLKSHRTNGRSGESLTHNELKSQSEFSKQYMSKQIEQRSIGLSLGSNNNVGKRSIEKTNSDIEGFLAVHRKAKKIVRTII